MKLLVAAYLALLFLLSYTSGSTYEDEDNSNTTTASNDADYTDEPNDQETTTLDSEAAEGSGRDKFGYFLPWGLYRPLVAVAPVWQSTFNGYPGAQSIFQQAIPPAQTMMQRPRVPDTTTPLQSTTTRTAAVLPRPQDYREALSVETKCGTRQGKQTEEGDDESGEADRDERLFIVTGKETSIDVWPWQAIIRYDDLKICSGTLIDSRHVATAAHCIEKAMELTSLKVLLGKSNSEEAATDEVVRNVEKIAIHPNFGKSRRFDADIALIRLSQPVTMSSSVTPICLPSQGTKIPSDVRCVATGYGDTTEEGSNSLKVATATLLTNARCVRLVPNLKKEMTKNMVCAGAIAGGTDACQGDLGSPLVCETNRGSSVFALQGISSFGIDCNSPKFPGVYVRVANFATWITKTIARWQ